MISRGTWTRISAFYDGNDNDGNDAGEVPGQKERGNAGQKFVPFYTYRLDWIIVFVYYPDLRLVFKISLINE